MKNSFILFMILCGSILVNAGSFKTDLGLSYVQTSGNTSTQTFSWNLSGEGNIDTVRILAGVSYLTTRNRGVEQARKLNSTIRVERNFAGAVFGFLEALYKQDKFSGYTYRTSVGPGLGCDIFKNDKRSLKGLVSALYYFDKYFVGDKDLKKYSSAKIALDYSCKLSKTALIKTSGDYQTSLHDQHHYFINGEANLNVNLNSRLAVGLSYIINYQNKKPAPDIKKTDTSFLTSLLVHL